MRPQSLDSWTGSDDLGDAVLVIGSGPVGLAVRSGLRRLGRRVVLLEAGGADATRDSAYNAGGSVGLPFSGLGSRARGLGGNSALWAGQCMRFHVADLAPRPWLDQSGWPIGYDTLAPWYGEAERFLEVSADDYQAVSWRRFGLDPDTLPDEGVETRFSVFAGEPDLWRRERGGIERDPGTEVLYDAVAAGFLVEDGRVRGVEVRSPGGARRTLRAAAVVVATGAIEAARLLLLPTESAPRGLADGNPHVGAHFQDHPHGAVAAIDPVDEAAARRVVDWFTLFHHRGVRLLPKLTRTIEAQAADQVLNACAVPVYEWPPGSLFDRMRGVQAAVLGRRVSNGMLDAVRAAAAEPGELLAYGLGRARGRSYAGLRPQRLLLQLYIEQDPATDSRVALGEERDASGLPVVTVDWRLGERERHTALSMVSALDRFFRAWGVGGAAAEPALLGDDWRSSLADNQHHAGTARMSTDPAHGVVDTSCRVWGTDNVWVAGGAVFPTSSYANPTLTMIAMGLRVARAVASS